MDLKKLSTKEASEHGAVMEIVHPETKAPIVGADGVAATITLAGQDSTQYRSIQHRQANAILKNSHRGRMNITAEQSYENTLNTLAKCTLAWQGIEWHGKPLKCTEENAVMLYRELDWLVADVETFMTDRTNYLGNSSKS